MRHSSILAALVFLVAVASPAPACKFCCQPEKRTIRQDLRDSVVIGVGTFSNPRLEAEYEKSRTDVDITAVLRTHPDFDVRTITTINRFVPAGADPQKSRFIILFDVYKKKLDLIRILAATPEMIDHVESLMAHDADEARVLRHCFDCLDSADAAVAADALLEIKRLPADQLEAFARQLPADTLRGWLRNPKATGEQLNLYAVLLAHCGNASDGDRLRAVIKREENSDVWLEDVFMANVMVQPIRGWAYLRETVASSHRPFRMRANAYAAARRFYEIRPGIVDKDDIVGFFGELLDDPEFADLAIDDLRKWQRWELTGRVVSLHGKPGYETRMMLRSIIRFAIQSPRAEAAALLKTIERTDAELVASVRELLQLE